jgi:hypothetical protein
MHGRDWARQMVGKDRSETQIKASSGGSERRTGKKKKKKKKKKGRTRSRAESLAHG